MTDLPTPMPTDPSDIGALILRFDQEADDPWTAVADVQNRLIAEHGSYGGTLFSQGMIAFQRLAAAARVNDGDGAVVTPEQVALALASLHAAGVTAAPPAAAVIEVVIGQRGPDNAVIVLDAAVNALSRTAVPGEYVDQVREVARKAIRRGLADQLLGARLADLGAVLDFAAALPPTALPPTPDLITPEIASHVLWQYGLPGGYEPGSWTRALLVAITRADRPNRQHLATAFPGYVLACHMVEAADDGAHALAEYVGAPLPPVDPDDDPAPVTVHRAFTPGVDVTVTRVGKEWRVAVDPADADPPADVVVYVGDDADSVARYRGGVWS